MAKKDIAELTIRTCRTLHVCFLCRQPIYAGEKYHDGGYGRRAHVDCARKGKRKINEKQTA